MTEGLHGKPEPIQGCALLQVFVYLAAAQMLFSSPRSSTLSALSGVLSGLVVTCSSMREWKVGAALPLEAYSPRTAKPDRGNTALQVPRPVCQWFGCSLGRLLRSTPARPAGRLPPGGHQRPGVTQVLDVLSRGACL